VALLFIKQLIRHINQQYLYLLKNNTYNLRIRHIEFNEKFKFKLFQNFKIFYQLKTFNRKLL